MFCVLTVLTRGGIEEPEIEFWFENPTFFIKMHKVEVPIT